MALGLKEKMARDRAAKEQKRAERMSLKSLRTGDDLVGALRKGRQVSESDLKRIVTAVTVFHEGGDDKQRVIDGLKPAQRVMYEVVKNELKGEWMGSFLKLIESLPDEKRFRPYTITWPEWREFGMHAGMTDEQTSDALKVMLVMRDR